MEFLQSWLVARGLLRGAERGYLGDHTAFGVGRALSALMPQQITDSILLGTHQEKMLFLGKYSAHS